jgi:hypothetical protein
MHQRHEQQSKQGRDRKPDREMQHYFDHDSTPPAAPPPEATMPCMVRPHHIQPPLT